MRDIFSLRKKRSFWSIVGLSFAFTIQSFIAIVTDGLKNRRLKNTVEITERPKADSDVPVFQDEFLNKHKDSIAIQLSNAFVEWRVERNPLCEYQTHYAYKAGRLQGYILLNQTNPKRFYITDFAFLETMAGMKLLHLGSNLSRGPKMLAARTRITSWPCWVWRYWPIFSRKRMAQPNPK